MTRAEWRRLGFHVLEVDDSVFVMRRSNGEAWSAPRDDWSFCDELYSSSWSPAIPPVELLQLASWCRCTMTCLCAACSGSAAIEGEHHLGPHREEAA